MLRKVLCAALLTLWPVSPLCLLLQYPLLTAHYKRVADLPGIKEYLASPQRLEKVNGNGLG